jgi:hypothetical protein
MVPPKTRNILWACVENRGGSHARLSTKNRRLGICDRCPVVRGMASPKEDLKGKGTGIKSVAELTPVPFVSFPNSPIVWYRSMGFLAKALRHAASALQGDFRFWIFDSRHRAGIQKQSGFWIEKSKKPIFPSALAPLPEAPNRAGSGRTNSCLEPRVLSPLGRPNLATQIDRRQSKAGLRMVYVV